MSFDRQAFRSTVFVAINTYVSVAVGFVTSIILARLLLPEHYGIVALANFFLSLIGRIKEFGFDQALVHKKDDLDKAFSNHFILQVSLAFLNLLIVLIAFPILRHFYQDQPSKLASVNILIVLAIFVIFQAASTTQQIALEKELAFGYTSLINIVALVIASGTAILAAYKGFGYWSLVIGPPTGGLYLFLIWLGLWIIRPWKLRIVFDKKMIKWFFSFGKYLWIGAFTTFILYQYNDFILGNFLTAAILGFYAKALNFAQLPNSIVASVVSRVALPAYAKLQDEKERLSRTFNFVLRNVVRLSFPMSLLMFVTAREFITFLIGEKWLPMVPIFQLLVLYSLLRPIFDDTGAFLTAIGKPKLVSLYIAIQAGVLLILSPLLTYFWGVNGAALSLNMVMLLGVVLAYYFVHQNIKVEFFNNFGPTIIASVFSYLASMFIFDYFGFFSQQLVLILMQKIAVIGAIYTITIFILERGRTISDLKYLVKMVRNRE